MFKLIWKVGISFQVPRSDLIAKSSKLHCLLLPSTTSVHLVRWKYRARCTAADPELKLTPTKVCAHKHPSLNLFSPRNHFFVISAYCIYIKPLCFLLKSGLDLIMQCNVTSPETAKAQYQSLSRSRQGIH